MHPFNRLVAILLLTLISARDGAAQGVPDPAVSAFRDAYKTEGARLRNAYRTLRGSGTLSVKAEMIGRGSTDEKFRLRFAAQDGSTRVDRTWDFGPPGSETNGFQDVLLNNDRIRLHASLPTAGGPYVADRVERPGEPPAETGLGYIFPSYVLAATHLMGRDLDELLADPKFRIGRVEEIANGENAVLRVHFESRHDPDLGVVSGWFEVAPRWGWSITSYEFGRGRGHTEAGVTSYDTTSSPPVPVHHRTVQTARTGASEFVFSFEEFKFAKSPESQFRSSSLGLGVLEQVRPTTNPNLLSYVLWGLGGLVLLATVIVRWRSK